MRTLGPGETEGVGPPLDPVQGGGLGSRQDFGQVGGAAVLVSAALRCADERATAGEPRVDQRLKHD